MLVSARTIDLISSLQKDLPDRFHSGCICYLRHRSMKKTLSTVMHPLRRTQMLPALLQMWPAHLVNQLLNAFSVTQQSSSSCNDLMKRQGHRSGDWEPDTWQERYFHRHVHWEAELWSKLTLKPANQRNVPRFWWETRQKLRSQIHQQSPDG